MFHQQFLPKYQQDMVCRGCLEVDTEFSYVNDFSIAQSYEILLGIPHTEGVPRLCQFCLRTLLKFREFRTRCLKAAELLHLARAQGHFITKEYSLHLIASNHEFKKRYVKTDIITLDVETGQTHVQGQTEAANDFKIEKREKDDELDDADTHYDGEGTVVGLLPKSEDIQNDTDIAFCEVSVEDTKIQLTKETISDNVKQNVLETSKRVSKKNNCKINNSKINNSKLNNSKLNNSKKNDSKRNNSKKIKQDSTKDIKPINVKGLKTKRFSNFTRIIVEHATSQNFKAEFISYAEQIKYIEQKKRETIKKGYKCFECGKRFREFTTMERHRSNHVFKPNSFVCDICSWVCKNKIRLKAHLKGHSWLFICELCGFKTGNQSDLRTHSDFHKGKRFNCKYCGLVFNKKSTHLTHVRLTHTSELSFCELCGELFIGDKGLVMHKKYAHNTVDEFPYNCERCDKKFESQKALDRHNAIDGCKRPSCARCGDSFANDQLLKHHLVKRHIPPVADTFDCDRCHVRFYNNDARAHHECWRGEVCAQCGQTFEDDKLLTEHVYLRHDILKCDECNKTFSSSVYFKRHCARSHTESAIRKESGKKSLKTEPSVATHIGSKPMVKSSVRKWRIVGPDLMKEKPEKEEQITNDVTAVCEVCGKGFKSPSFLKSHQQNCHSDTGHFFCTLCSKRFKSKLQLKLHGAAHSGERPYKCPQCVKAFKIPSAFYRHRRLVHSGERSHVCSLCSRAFQTSTSVKQHIRTAHLHLPWPKRDRRPKRDGI